MRRRRAKIPTFKIVLTAVRPDGTTAADTQDPAWYRGPFARNEQRRPERVVQTTDVSDGPLSREFALGTAAIIASSLPAAVRPNYRVKVVPA